MSSSNPASAFFDPVQKKQLFSNRDLVSFFNKEKALVFAYEGKTGSVTVNKKPNGFISYILYYDKKHHGFRPPAAQIFPGRNIRGRYDFYSRQWKFEDIFQKHSSPLFLATSYGEWLHLLGCVFVRCYDNQFVLSYLVVYSSPRERSLQKFHNGSSSGLHSDQFILNGLIHINKPIICQIFNGC